MADEARAQRAAALEEKKRRLAELKARGARRSKRDGDDAAKATTKAAASSNLDEYIDGLLKSPAAVVPPSADAKPTENGTEPPLVEEPKQIGESATDGKDNVIAVAVAPAPAPPVKSVETFTTGTQTLDEDFSTDAASENGEDEQPDDTEKGKDDERAVHKTEDEQDDAAAPKLLSPEEAEAEAASVPFSSFLNTASKKVERMLGTPVLADLLVNYVGETDGVDATERPSDGSRFVTARQVFECAKWTATRDVTDMDWSPVHRELMLSSYHMQSSSSSGALSAGSAALSAVSPDDTPSASLAPRSGELQSDGLALVWSLAMPTRPEHIFTCGSPVLNARFHPTEAPLVVGGCHSGQVVVWDIRAGRLPVQRSSLTTVASAKGHAHPICSMEIVEGGVSSPCFVGICIAVFDLARFRLLTRLFDVVLCCFLQSGLVTAATDGRVNFWSLANLRDAAESLQVGGNISCLSVAPESNTLVCGDESGALHTIQSTATGGAQRSTRRPVRTLEAGDGEGHFGMVTAVATKPLQGTSASRSGLSKGFLRGAGGLVLSSGVDWTTKLWAPAYTDKPLLSFVSHSYDYMCDVQWSPTHPSLFATASSNGSMGLWNLASSLDEPVSGSEGIVVEPDAASGRGLNKLKWSSDGRRMLAASADRVHVLNMSEDALRQKGDEDTRMMHNLTSRGMLELE